MGKVTTRFRRKVGPGFFVGRDEGELKLSLEQFVPYPFP